MGIFRRKSNIYAFQLYYELFSYDFQARAWKLFNKKGEMTIIIVRNNKFQKYRNAYRTRADYNVTLTFALCFTSIS